MNIRRGYNVKTCLVIVLAGLVFNTAISQALCPVIPLPSQAAAKGDIFLLNKQTSLLVTTESLRPVAHYLQQQLLQTGKLPLSIRSETSNPAIQLRLSKQVLGGEEAYSLAMSSEEIVITGNSNKGVFYGVITLLQLIAQSRLAGETIRLDCWNITDAPKYSWRGFMLDESRHFFGMEKVKSILDWMAFYKLNRFHWHLTDEPAWRFEIKNYPLLALVGGIGSYTNPNEPAQFYTQQQIAEMVRYAAERQITVIPEIDMPGHATAANRAYPQYSGGGSAKHPEFTFHPGKEDTYQYLSNILQETNALFPSGMLHLGGDEVSFGNDKWMADDSVRQLMQRNGWKNANDVERYFMRRMADSVFSMNAKLLAWDEVADMNLPREKVIVFWWRQDKPEQLATLLNNGYSTVLCPRLPFYFDFVQDSTHTEGRKWNRRYNSLREVYDFSAETLSPVSSTNQQHILGIQANLWTETMPNEARLDYMLFPRIAALAEVAWGSRKDYDLFKKRLITNFKLYKQAGINFYNPF